MCGDGERINGWDRVRAHTLFGHTCPLLTVATRFTLSASPARLLQARFVVPGTSTSPLGAASTVGAGVGETVGCVVGRTVGCVVGRCVGAFVGGNVEGVGLCVGRCVGGVVGACQVGKRELG